RGYGGHGQWLPRRYEESHAEREEEETREEELGHRCVKPWIERKMGAVEVADAVSRLPAQRGERVCETEHRAGVVEPPRHEVDAHRYPRRGHRRDHGTDRTQRAPPRQSSR